MATELELLLRTRLGTYEATTKKFASSLMAGEDPALVLAMKTYLEYIAVNPIPQLPDLITITQHHLMTALAAEREPLIQRLIQSWGESNASEVKATLGELGIKLTTDNPIKIMHQAGVFLLSNRRNPLD